MDSLTQIALGSAVGVAVMGRRTAPWKAALWGAACGTLPDLDAFIDHGDAVRNMTMHRADSHALLWLAMLSVPIGAVAARIHGEWHRWRRWVLAIGCVLVTHPLLDWMTIYGTQLLRPFSREPYGVGSLFIIDPLYTLPLLVGLGLALARRAGRGLRANRIGLALSTLYLGWSVFAQHTVEGVARASLAAQGIAAEQVLVTPTAFNTVLWRVVAITPDGYHEGFRSLLDGDAPIRFDRFDRGAALRTALAGHDPVERVAWFSRGFWAMEADGDRVTISDLRMGQAPSYFFTFVVGARADGTWRPVSPPTRVGTRPDVRRGLAWLGQRALGHEVAPPR